MTSLAKEDEMNRFSPWVTGEGAGEGRGSLRRTPPTRSNGHRTTEGEKDEKDGGQVVNVCTYKKQIKVSLPTKASC